MSMNNFQFSDFRRGGASVLGFVVACIGILVIAVPLLSFAFLATVWCIKMAIAL